MPEDMVDQPVAPIAVAAKEDGNDYIRAYKRSDHTAVKMLIGQGIMEGLARSNNQIYRNPFVLLIWISLSLYVDHRFDYRPKPDIPLSSLSPLIGFATVALPILGIVEYFNRPSFTRLLRETIGSPDVVSPDQFYALDPRSQCLVFEHKTEVIGMIAVDGKRPGMHLGTVLGGEEGEIADNNPPGLGDIMEETHPTATLKLGLRQRNEIKKLAKSNILQTHGTVQIRHLGVDAPFRRKKVGLELVTTALDHVFGIALAPGTTQKVIPADRVIVMSFPLTPGGDKFFTKLGFKRVSTSQSEIWAQPPQIGLFKAKGRWLEISRDDWFTTREKLFPPKEK